MRLPFQKNKTLTGSYDSPYGVLEMKTSTTRISHKFDENVRKGEIDLLYDLRCRWFSCRYISFNDSFRGG